jgi:hypothetical protein
MTTWQIIGLYLIVAGLALVAARTGFAVTKKGQPE